MGGICSGRSDPTALCGGIVMESMVATVLTTEVLENSLQLIWKTQDVYARHRICVKNFLEK